MTNSIVYFLWLIINASILFGAIYLFFRYTRLINKRVGTIPAVLFVVFSLSSISSISSANTEMKDKTIIFNTTDSHAYTPKLKAITIDENMLSKILFLIDYQYNTTKTTLIPLRAYTSQSGFIGGIQWVQNDIQINKTSANTISYQVRGEYSWLILGRNIYKQAKNYTGDISLE